MLAPGLDDLLAETEAERDALAAENAKLREALQDIVQYAQSNLEANHYPIEQVNWRGIQDIARAALA